MSWHFLLESWNEKPRVCIKDFFSLKGTQRYITAQHVFIDKWDLFSLTTMGWQYWAHSSNPSLFLESRRHIASESFNIILHPCQHSHFLWSVSGDNRITPPNMDPNYYSLNIVTFMESLSILWKQWALNKTFIFCQYFLLLTATHKEKSYESDLNQIWV